MRENNDNNPLKPKSYEHDSVLQYSKGNICIHTLLHSYHSLREDVARAPSLCSVVFRDNCAANPIRCAYSHYCRQIRISACIEVSFVRRDYKQQRSNGITTDKAAKQELPYNMTYALICASMVSSSYCGAFCVCFFLHKRDMASELWLRYHHDHTNGSNRGSKTKTIAILLYFSAEIILTSRIFCTMPSRMTPHRNMEKALFQVPALFAYVTQNRPSMEVRLQMHHKITRAIRTCKLPFPCGFRVIKSFWSSEDGSRRLNASP